MSWNVVVTNTATGLISDARLGFPAVNGAATLEAGTAAGAVTKYELKAATGAASLESLTATGVIETSTGDISISTIPNLNIVVGETIDLVGLYVNDPLGQVTDSQVLNLNNTYATYTHAGGLVGVLDTPVAMPNLYLEVTYV